MTKTRLARISARIACLCLASAWAPVSATRALGDDVRDVPGSGPDNAIEVVLPPELQAMLFHSLPIAGLLVTPDTIAERVLTHPRLRATAAPPITGKGEVYPVRESGAVGTRADLTD